MIFWRKLFHLFLASLLLIHLVPQDIQAAIQINPAPIAQPSSSLPLLQGVRINPEQPFDFEFYFNDHATDQSLIYQQIQFFFTALTLPADDLWVNLSPNPDEATMSSNLAQTSMGAILLEQDFYLKQLTAQETHPDKSHAEEFWNKFYEQLLENSTNTNIPDLASHRVWIVPSEANMINTIDAALIEDSSLQVLSEEMYENQLHQDQSLLVSDHLLPSISHEINTNPRFHPLRQIYHAVLLAQWFKQQSHPLNNKYTNQAITTGIHEFDPQQQQTIYELFKTNLDDGELTIKQPFFNPNTQEVTSIQFATGGVQFPATNFIPGGQTLTQVTVPTLPDNGLLNVRTKLLPFLPELNAVADVRNKILRRTTKLLAALAVGGSLFLAPNFSEAADFSRNSNNQLEIKIDAGDTLSHVVQEVRVQFKRNDPTGYEASPLSKKMWGKNGAVKYFTDNLKPVVDNSDNIHPTDQWKLTNNILPSSVVDELTGEETIEPATSLLSSKITPTAAPSLSKQTNQSEMGLSANIIGDWNQSGNFNYLMYAGLILLLFFSYRTTTPLPSDEDHCHDDHCHDHDHLIPSPAELVEHAMETTNRVWERMTRRWINGSTFLQKNETFSRKMIHPDYVFSYPKQNGHPFDYTQFEQDLNESLQQEGTTWIHIQAMIRLLREKNQKTILRGDKDHQDRILEIYRRQLTPSYPADENKSIEEWLITIHQQLLNTNPRMIQRMRILRNIGFLKNRLLTTHNHHQKWQQNSILGIGLFIILGLTFLSPNMKELIPKNFTGIRNSIEAIHHMIPGLHLLHAHETQSLSLFSFSILLISNLINPIYYTLKKLQGITPRLYQWSKTAVQLDWAFDYTISILITLQAISANYSSYGMMVSLIGLIIGSRLPFENNKERWSNMIILLLATNVLAAGWEYVLLATNAIMIHLLFDSYVGMLIGKVMGDTALIQFSEQKATKRKTLKVLTTALGLTAATTIGLTFAMTSSPILSITTVLAGLLALKMKPIIQAQIYANDNALMGASPEQVGGIDLRGVGQQPTMQPTLTQPMMAGVPFILSIQRK